MEPAVRRREHAHSRQSGNLLAWANRLVTSQPQWSPPLKRREHPGTEGGRDHAVLAAMEPAAKRREHQKLVVHPWYTQGPQWSPLLNTGSVGVGA